MAKVEVESRHFSNGLNLGPNNACRNLFSFGVSDVSLLKKGEINFKEQPSSFCYQGDNDLRFLRHTDYKVLSTTAGKKRYTLDLLGGADPQKSNHSTESYLNPELHNVQSMAPNNTDTSNVSNISLNSLAEQHLKFDSKSQESKDSTNDADFSLSDLLFDGEHILSAEKPNENHNFANVTFSISDPDALDLPSSCKREVFDENELSVFLESTEACRTPSNNLSLADLANNHFIENSVGNLNDKLIVSTEVCDNINLELNENFKNVFSHGKLDDDVLIKGQKLSDIFDITSTGILESFIEDEKIVKLDTLEDGNLINTDLGHYKNKENISDFVDTYNEIIPEIDLSFCIKKHKNSSFDNFVSTSYSDSSDSGFDETDFTSSKIIQNFQDFRDAYTSNKEIKSTLINPKESLLSKAISCKPLSDRTKMEKIKKIKKELFMKTFPKSFTDYKEQFPKLYDTVKDQSNQCVVTGINRFNVPDN